MFFFAGTSVDPGSIKLSYPNHTFKLLGQGPYDEAPGKPDT